MRPPRRGTRKAKSLESLRLDIVSRTLRVVSMKPRPFSSFCLYTFLTALITAFASGCAGIPSVLPPEARSQVDHTDARSFVPQSEVNVQYLLSNYSSGLGLIGAFVDLGVNSAKAGSAETQAQR